MEDERNTQQYGHQSGENGADQVEVEVEVKERGLFDTLLGRKKPEDLEKKQEEELVAGVSVPAEPEKKEYEHEAAAASTGEKKESLLAKLHRTGSSSSSSSDEEEEFIDGNGEIVRRRKKKGLKEKIKEKLPGQHKDHHDQLDGEHKPYAAPAPAPVATHAYDHHQEEAEHKPYAVPAAPAPVATHAYQPDDDHKAYVPAATPEEEKKGILEKLKEKLPGGGHKKPEDATPAHASAAAPAHAPSPNYGEEVGSPDGKEKKQGLLGKIMDKIPGYNKGPAEEDHKAAAPAAGGEHKTSS